MIGGFLDGILKSLHQSKSSLTFKCGSTVNLSEFDKLDSNQLINSQYCINFETNVEKVFDILKSEVVKDGLKEFKGKDE